MTPITAKYMNGYIKQKVSVLEPGDIITVYSHRGDIIDCRFSHFSAKDEIIVICRREKVDSNVWVIDAIDLDNIQDIHLSSDSPAGTLVTIEIKDVRTGRKGMVTVDYLTEIASFSLDRPRKENEPYAVVTRFIAAKLIGD